MNAWRQGSFGQEPVQDRVCVGKRDVRSPDRGRLPVGQVRIANGCHETLPAKTRDVEEEPIERPPVVIDEAGGLSEGPSHEASGKLLTPKLSPSLQKITDDPGSLLFGNGTHACRHGAASLPRMPSARLRSYTRVEWHEK